MESLGFVLMYFLRGSLPWQGLKVQSLFSQYSHMCRRKLSFKNMNESSKENSIPIPISSVKDIQMNLRNTLRIALPLVSKINLIIGRVFVCPPSTYPS